MNKQLLFDFSVNKDKNAISVKREFASMLENVWSAWTEPELIDLWWAPKPYKNKTKSMDFREGGYWLYAMVSPEDEIHWCRADYKKIDPLKTFSALDAFCDETGKVNEDFPRSFWTNSFTENAETTTVNIVIEYDKLEDLEKVIEMGFKEGFTMALQNLDQYIEKQSQLCK